MKLTKKKEGIMTDIEKQINLVVEMRGIAQEAIAKRTGALQTWQDEHEHLYMNERDAKSLCQEAEDQLRELALVIYAETQDKQVAPGIGIRVRQVLDYEPSKAMEWALEHHMALKLDGPMFEKMAKVAPETRPSFVTITEEPTVTIATELLKVE